MDEHKSKTELTSELRKLRERVSALTSELEERKQNEGTLNESVKRLRTMLESAPDAVYLSSLTGKIVDGNAAAEELIGYDKEELIGKNFMSVGLVTAKQLPKIAAILAKSVAGKPTGPEELCLQRKDGQTRFAEIRTSPVTLGGEKLILGHARDITERIQAEEALRESERFLKEAQAIAHLGHWRLDPSTGIVDGSDELFRIFGINPKDATLEDFDVVVHADDREVDRELIRRGIEQGRPWQNEHRLCCEDGTEKVVHTIGNPITDAAGKTILVLGTVQDITERKRVEVAFRESEETLRALVETSRDWIWSIDRNNVHTFCSPGVEQILGYAADEIVGRSSAGLMHEEDSRAIEEQLPIWVTEKRGWRNLTLRWFHKDGSIRYLESNAVPITEPDGELLGFRGIDRDITERMQAEKERYDLETQLRQAQKMEALGALAGGIAHDFNNLLQAILGYADLAQSEAPKDSAISKFVDGVIEGGNRAAELVTQILAFSRQTEREGRPLLLQSILQDAVKLLRPSLPSTIEIKQHIDSDCGPIIADATEMHQVIMNLCTNAYHAMQDTGGILDVGLTEVDTDSDPASTPADLKPGRYVRLAVSDTGAGIAESDLPRVFDPYFTTKAVGAGTGLGLATVLGIVESYGGGVDVTSQVDDGSLFEIFLPTTRHRVTRDASQETTEDTSIVGTERILFVDDERMVAEQAVAGLERFGYQVEARTSSVEALEAFRSTPQQYDVVVTDQTMPHMTGLELAQELLKIRPGTPIILCTGYSELVDDVIAAEAGISEFVKKPILTRPLAAAIRHAIDPTY